jgi:hypothetical protein
MLGKAAVAMWWDIAPEVRSEWEDWHTREHMPERLGIPGFLRGTRAVALSGEPSYFVLYEARQLATITAGPYVEHLNNPTPWSRQMMPHHRNMVRSLCRVREGYGGGIAHAIATLRFSKRGKIELPRGNGLTSAHLLKAQPMPGEQTTEQKIRGGDASADRVLLIRGHDAGTVEAAASEMAATLRGATVGLYRVAYSLTPKDVK